jgi:putative transposase
MLVTQAYRFELDPNDKCRSKLASHAGAARFTYNWGLALVGNHLSARRALAVLAIRQGAGRGDAECWADGLLGPLPWTLPALRRAWNQAKDTVAPWWAENSKESYNSGLGFPRFKASHTRRSFRVTTGAFGVVDDRHVRLPRIGLVLVRLLKVPTGVSGPVLLKDIGGDRCPGNSIS